MSGLISGDHIAYVIDQTCKIQQISAPTFEENERAEYVFAEMGRIGLVDVQRDYAGNVLGRYRGGHGRPIVISAHLDTVHKGHGEIPLLREPTCIQGPGIADNSMGLGALLGTAAWLKQTAAKTGGDVWFAADVGEEGLGNLAGMKALVDTFGDKPLLYLVLEGLGLGQICHRGLGVLRFRISAAAKGGHAWVNYGDPSAIHELARVVSALADFSLPNKPRTSLNVGRIQGGVSINTIAPSAWCEIDLRSEDQVTLSRLASRVRKLVQSHEKSGLQFVIEQIGSRPAGGLSTSHPLIYLTAEILGELNLPVTLVIGSTDANIPLSKGYPSICIGVTLGGCPHTENEFIQLDPIEKGLEQIVRLVQSAWAAQAA